MRATLAGVTLAALLALLVLSRTAPAQITAPAGVDFQANTYTADAQTEAAVAALASGGYVVAWQSAGQDGDGLGVFFRRYGADGTPLGAEVGVNEAKAGNQYTPAVSGLGDGGFVVAWQEDVRDGDGLGVMARRYDAHGRPHGGEFPLNAHAAGHQYGPALAGLSDGGFVAAWTSADQDGSGLGIYVRRYDAGGRPAGAEARVNAHGANDQYAPALAALQRGGFAVAWMSADQDGDGWGVYAQRFDAAGTPLGDEFQVNTFSAGDQQFPTAAGLRDGGFAVAWMSADQDGSGAGIFARQYDADGRALGDEFQVNAHAASEQYAPAATGLSGGGFAVVWMSLGQDGNGYGIYARPFRRHATPAADEFRLNAYTRGEQWYPAAAGLPGGGLVAAWHSQGQDGSAWGIFGRHATTVRPGTR